MTDTSLEVIVIDDSTSSHNNVCILVNDDSNETESSKLKQQNGKIEEENELFYKFINLCRNLEKSEGMIRITNKLLLRNYENLDPKYKSSHQFKRVLRNILNKLEYDSGHKFFHITSLLDILKLHQHKKRVQLITLSKNLDKTSPDMNGNNFNTNHKKRNHSLETKRKQKHTSIVINLDSEEDTVIDLAGSDESINKENSTSNHYNNCNNDNYTSKNNDSQNDKDNMQWSKNIQINDNSDMLSDKNTTENVCILEKTSLETENQFLVPFEYQEINVMDENKVKEIEEEIAFYRQKIMLLDETEVCVNSKYSPYIKSEKCKEKIVQLYKKLCDLTGAEPVKRREIRLQVIPGHPIEPVKYLEEFLNDNLKENGEPPFPDFTDVVLCVASANQNEKLGWTPAQIMNEAHALFKQCGSALQKRRKKREWRDLLSRVNAEEIQDPADTDMELLVRLEENKRIAQRKEQEVLERFTNMENSLKNPQLKLLVTNDEDSSDDSDDNDVHTRNNDTLSNRPSNGGCVNNNPVTENNIMNTSKVKLEPQDISSMLEELGDDFTATIIDIEDPFMVIEVSSESEDEQTNNE